MPNYTVTYTQYWSYSVEAESEEDAEDKAREMFMAEMYRPYAHTFYDEVSVECDGEEIYADFWEGE